MGGATCVAAIQTAAMAVATGVCRNVLISVGRTGYSGARVSSRLQQFPQFALAAEFEAPIGMFAPAQLYAQGARRLEPGRGDDSISDPFSPAPHAFNRSAPLRRRNVRLRSVSRRDGMRD